MSVCTRNARRSLCAARCLAAKVLAATIGQLRQATSNDKVEFVQRISDPALTEHPETGDPVKRLIQPVGIAFKGSGFYVNDSRNASSTTKAPGESKAAKKAEGSTSGEASSSSESKPAKSENKKNDS